MAILAVATPIVEDNYPVILSEAGSTFDRSFLLSWVEENGSGYFLRDESSPLDCCLIAKDKFRELYAFRDRDELSIFRVVTKL